MLEARLGEMAALRAADASAGDRFAAVEGPTGVVCLRADVRAASANPNGALRDAIRQLTQ